MFVCLMCVYVFWFWFGLVLSWGLEKFGEINTLKIWDFKVKHEFYVQQSINDVSYKLLDCVSLYLKNFKCVG